MVNAGSANGRPPDFDSGYEGSSPSPAANPIDDLLNEELESLFYYLSDSKSLDKYITKILDENSAYLYKIESRLQ